MKIAVICARGGSKRIPRKNIRMFSGKPLIVHPIRVALCSEIFDRVIVSTDDEDIAQVARDAGAEVPFMRPQELSGDHVGTTEVVAHAVGWMQKHADSDIRVACCIYPTAPFLRKEDLSAGLEQLKSGGWQFVFSATTFPAPVQRAFMSRDDGGIVMFFPENFETRSQDLPESFHDAGQFYWGTADAWLNQEKIFDHHSSIVQIPRWRAQDIDTEEDWTCAESIAEFVSNQP